MTMMSSFSIDEKHGDPILEALREELIEGVEQGPQAVEKTVAAWCARYPDREDAFRKEALAIRLFWGLREPERLGPYQLLDVLTVGGMGKIYRAREDVTGRVVAVKTVLAGRLSPAEQVKRFDTERRLLSRLHDTHIVPLLATGQEGDLLYMVMPFIPGVTLKSMIVSASGRNPGAEPFATFDALFADASKVESKKRMDATQPPIAPNPVESVKVSETPSVSSPGRDRRPADYLRHVVAMMEHVAGAVQHIHDAKILHRDLKPSNIMIESSGHSWVIDIGLGRELDQSEDALPGTVPDATRPVGGMTGGIGTLAYMAPEQLGPLSRVADPTQPARHDARTDVWGLGATLHELLTLHLPFPGQSVAEVARKIVSEPPERGNGSIPRELKAICLKALEKDPGERYESAAAFAADLRRWLDVRPTQAGESAVRRKAGRSLGWSLVCVRRLGFWSRRRPAAAFAAGLLTALLLVGILGGAEINQLNLVNARAQTAQVRAEAKATKAQLDAAQRAALPQLRRPIRLMDWFQKSWQLVRSLRGGSTSPDPQIQGQAAAALEGIDARVVKTIPGAARVVEFDPRSEHLLIVRAGHDEKRKPWFRTLLWDRTTYRTLVERDLGDGVIAFWPDGTPLQASWERDDPGRLRLYDVGSGTELRRFRSPLEGSSVFRAITLSRTGSHLAAVAFRARKQGESLDVDTQAATTIAVWDAASGQQLGNLEHKATQDVALSPDGRLLAAWNFEGEITVWTIPDRKLLSRFRVGRAPVFCLTFGRDPVWHEDHSVPPWLLAVGESTGLVTIWDLPHQRPRSTCRGSTFDVSAMDFSADGVLLLTAGRNPTKLWDVATGTCLLDLDCGDSINASAFAPDGRHIALGSARPDAPQRAAVEVVSLERGHGLHTLYGLKGVIEKTAFSPDGRLIAAVTHEWQIGLWDWPSGRLRGVLDFPIGRFVDNLGMAFDAAGQRFACSGGHKTRLWDLRTEQRIWERDLPGGLCDDLAFSAPDSLFLVRCETQSGRSAPFEVHPSIDPCVVRIYDLLSLTPRKAMLEITDFPRQVHAIRSAPGSKLFVVDGVGMEDGRPVRRSRVYSSPSGKLLRDLPTTVEAQTGSLVLFDPSGTVLAVALEHVGPRARYNLFDLPALSPRGVIDGLTLSLNLGGTQWLGYLDATDDQPVRLALGARGRPEPLLEVVRDLPSSPHSSNFSPDGRYVTVGNHDGTVSVLDLVETNLQLSKLRLGW